MINDTIHTAALSDLVGHVAERQGFPTVDEMNQFARRLVSDYPGLTSLTSIGASRSGDELFDLQIGSGENHILVIGNPHPDEPIGLATIQHLATRLCENGRLLQTTGSTWHFVLCIDPDGTRLNEAWYRGPITRSNVARNAYRPATGDQIEWTFPVEHEGVSVGNPVPETQALMRLIEVVRPRLVVSLHNADFGGGYFYVTGGDPTYWKALTDILTHYGVDLEGGLPDLPGANTLAPAVFELVSFGETFKALAAVDPELAQQALTGGSTRDYAARFGGQMLVCELPLWTDPRGTDTRESAFTFAEVLRLSATELKESAGVFEDHLDKLEPLLNKNSPFYPAAVDAFQTMIETAESRTADAESVGSRLATRAEVFTEMHGYTETMRLRAAGTLLRLLADSALCPEIKQAQMDLSALFNAWTAEIEADRPGHPVPISNLVAVQCAAILLAAGRVRDGEPV
ncbi:M14 family zinc carboxypeptidase [Arthrobacter sp. PM3]|uniref:M14 family zinc carboxypeptidase n=1 Tax=Arthrobacter sp. PM3 TaxID=2017685 RepID=UPI000E10D5C8|nr:M14 family zinc carboxypeptidase [Arthrobacter sp. PM3]AXJ09888.1 hypothetical protein CFN17_09825 [Arthrobacter sp. PM3]